MHWRLFGLTYIRRLLGAQPLCICAQRDRACRAALYASIQRGLGTNGTNSRPALEREKDVEDRKG